MSDFSEEKLPLMEAFYTLQGEGFHTGKAAYFIRLGGCDVGCVWCDVKDSWEAEKHPLITVANITEKAKEYPKGITVITGGEPLMHNLNSLTSSLQENGFATHLETSGTHLLSGTWDWVCFSPKKFKKPLDEFYQKASELKVIVYNKTDLGWAEEHRAKLKTDCKLFLQPEWSHEKKMLPLIIAYIKENPHWQMSLQTHKYMGIE